MTRRALSIAMLAGLATVASANPFAAATATRPGGTVLSSDAYTIRAVGNRTDGNFTFTVTLNQDVESFDAQGSSFNSVISVDINALAGAPAGSPVSIQKLGISADLEAFSPSWLSEMEIWFLDSTLSTATAIIGTPAGGIDTPGAGLFDLPLTDLTDSGLFDIPLGDGVLSLEFAEFFDDAAGVADGVWRAGSSFTIEATVIPAPAPAALLALGGLAATRRRR